MLFDKSQSISSVAIDAAGALPDASDLKRNDALALAAGVVGVGVIGTGLVIGTYAAPAPMIGGALVATALGVAAGTLDDGDADAETVTVKAEATADA